MEIVALVVAGLVMLYAYWLYKMGSDILDVDEHFHGAVWVFFGLFIAGAIAMYVMLPSPAKNANLGHLVNSWVHPVEAKSDNLPLYQ